jgi:hypothetical protein
MQGWPHPLCGCVAVAQFTSNANATLNWCSCLSPPRPASETAGQRRFQHDAATGTVSQDPMRYRFFPARLGSICCEPFEGEIGSDKTNGVTSATARQHH